MTKEETIKIMAMLNAFYAGGKNDPKQQATAWHLILQKYNYESASKAILNFAENDVRDYATFPAVGKIVAEIKKVEAEREAPIYEILHRIQTGLDYYGLGWQAKSLISEPQFNEWSRIDAEVFASRADKYAEILRNRRNCGNNISDLVGNEMKMLAERMERNGED